MNHLMIPGLVGGSTSDPFESLRTSLFGAGEQGLWPRPDRFGEEFMQYQGNTAVTLVTAVGQTVGWAADWRLGRELGVEEVTNGTFDSDVSGWTASTSGPTSATISWESGQLKLQRTGSSTGFASAEMTGLNVGQWYQISFTKSSNDTLIRVHTSSSLSGTPAYQLAYGTATSGSGWFVAEATTMYFIVASTSMSPAFFDNLSVRELPGNHAYQATASKRPLLARVPARGRVNEFLRTEEFDNSYWSKQDITVTPNVAVNPINGMLNAELITSGSIDKNYGIFKGLSHTSATASFHVKADSGIQFLQIYNTTAAGFANFDIVNGVAGTTGSGMTSSIEALGDGWFRISLGTMTGTVIYLNPVTSNAAGRAQSNVLPCSFYLWGAQLEVGSTTTNYQRVGAGTYDVTEEGQPTLYGWLFDGVDDNLETNAYDPATDKVTVVTGVRKLSDVNSATVAEHGPTTQRYRIRGPQVNGVANYGFSSAGTVAPLVTTPSSYPAPDSSVLSAIGDIAGDICRLRVNGTVQAGPDTYDQGTGNYANSKTFIGATQGTSAFFNGYTFFHCTRFTATPTPLLENLEDFAAVRTLGAEL